MSLPVLAKTWQFDVNRLLPAVAAGATTITQWNVAIKESLKGFASSPWVVGYSCDGTTAGTPGDGVDRWPTSGFTFPSSASRCWMVLKQAGASSGNLQIVLGASGNGTYCVFQVSEIAGFTGGSTSAFPTTTDMTSYNTTSGTVGTASVNRALHVMQTTDGTCTRFCVTRNGIIENHLLLEEVANAVSGFTPAQLCYCRGYGTNLDNFKPIYLSSTGGNWSFVSSGIKQAALTCEGFYNSWGGNLSPIGATPNDFSGEWPMLPCAYVGVTAGARGRLGTAVDLWLGNEGAANASTYPNDTSYQFAQWGCLILPWNGTVPVQE